MPLDRTWYNSLVDDDGSNTVGTVWGKDDVDALMDAVDASLPTLWQGWTPSWRTSTGEGTTPAQSSCRYYRVGNVVHINIFAADLFFATAADALQFSMPPDVAILTPTIERYAVMVRLGQTSPVVYELGYGTAANATLGEVRRGTGANFPGFTHASLHGQGFYLL